MSRALRLAAAAVLLAFCTLTAARAADPSVATDQHGRSHVWRGPTGQLTLLEFAASWCAPCRKTLPRLEAFAREHPDLRVLTVSVDEHRQGRDELVDSLRLSLPMLWDEEHRIAEHYQPKAMPPDLSGWRGAVHRSGLADRRLGKARAPDGARAARRANRPLRGLALSRRGGRKPSSTFTRECRFSRSIR